MSVTKRDWPVVHYLRAVVYVAVRSLIVNRQDIGQRVLDRRLELGFYRQSEAAQAAGVSPTTWTLLEAQGQPPKTMRLRHQIARALQWPPDVFDQMLSGVTPEPVRTPTDDVAAALERGLELIAEAVRSGRDEDRRWYADQIEHLRWDLNESREERSAPE